MRRRTTLALTALVLVGLLVGGVGGVQATHDNPEWGQNPGDSGEVADCSTGHVNPHDDGDWRTAADDCGVDRGMA